MEKYVKITSYLNGDSIEEQLQKISDNGLLDENTRLFFGTGSMIRDTDLETLSHRFDMTTSIALRGVVLFKPQKWYLESLDAKKQNEEGSKK